MRQWRSLWWLACGGGWCALAAGGGGVSAIARGVIGSGEGCAGSAWLKSDHPGRRVGQSEGHRFLRGSAYEPGLRIHLSEGDSHAASLELNW